MRMILLALILCVSQAYATRQLALKLVASIESQILTNRDVEANYLIDRALYKDGQFATVAMGTEDFSNGLNRLLVEMMVSEEATFFEVAKVSEAEIDENFKRVKVKIQASPLAKSRLSALNFSETQMRGMVSRKLRANRFIKYKSESSFVQPSEEEAREYFNKNRLKFGTMEYDNFKDTIRKGLANRNAEDRLKDWFEILRKKHKVKNYVSGTLSYDFSTSPNK